VGVRLPPGPPAPISSLDLTGSCARGRKHLALFPSLCVAFVLHRVVPVVAARSRRHMRVQREHEVPHSPTVGVYTTSVAAVDAGAPASELGTLDILIDGDWTLQGFRSLLDSIDATYRACRRLVFVTEHPESADDVQSRTSPASQQDDIWPQIREAWDERARPQYPDLVIASLKYSSPGTVGILGALNPLTILADFVIAWRQQNLDKYRAEQSHAQQLLILMSPKKRDQWGSYLIRDIAQNAELIAADQRVKSLQPPSPFVRRLTSDQGLQRPVVRKTRSTQRPVAEPSTSRRPVAEPNTSRRPVAKQNTSRRPAAEQQPSEGIPNRIRRNGPGSGPARPRDVNGPSVGS
jgi:hypothetical protein